MSAIGTVEDVDKFSRRQVRVTKEQNEECRTLLRLMGIPVVVVSDFSQTTTQLTSTQAPSEAEAQCAELARGGLVRSQATCWFDANIYTGLCRWFRRYGHFDVQLANPPSSSHLQ